MLAATPVSAARVFIGGACDEAGGFGLRPTKRLKNVPERMTATRANHGVAQTDTTSLSGRSAFVIAQAVANLALSS